MWLILVSAGLSVITGARLIVSAIFGTRADASARVPAAQVVRDGARKVRDREPLELAARLLGGAFLVVVGIVAIVIVSKAG